jgi:hypothetical protein
MRIRCLALLIVAGLLAVPHLAAARNYGDGFGIGGVLLPDSSQALLMKTRLGDNMALEGLFSFDHSSDEDESDTHFMLGGGILSHWNTEERLQPFIGGRLTISHWSVDRGQSDSSDTSFGFAGVVGAEYFAMKNLSLEGEIGVGFHFGTFGMSTSSSLAAFLYL